MKILEYFDEIRNMLLNSSISNFDFDKISNRLEEMKLEFDISQVSISLDEIAEISRVYFGLKKNFNTVRSRDRNLVLGRQFAMVFMIKYSKKTRAEIGLYFKRDHSTVIHADKTITNQINNDRIMLKHYNEINKLIQIKFAYMTVNESIIKMIA